MESENTLPPFLEYLKRNRENPGVMADLRCALIPTREHRAWQYIARFYKLGNDRERVAAATVAAAFGLQPECGGQWENMGDVMRRIALGEDGRNGLTTYSARFQRLLACDTPEELSQQLHGVFKAAKSHGIPVNHQNLLYDMFGWGEKVKRRWAEHYWPNVEKEQPEGDGADE